MTAHIFERCRSLLIGLISDGDSPSLGLYTSKVASMVVKCCLWAALEVLYHQIYRMSHGYRSAVDFNFVCQPTLGRRRIQGLSSRCHPNILLIRCSSFPCVSDAAVVLTDNDWVRNTIMDIHHTLRISTSTRGQSAGWARVSCSNNIELQGSSAQPTLLPI